MILWCVRSNRNDLYQVHEYNIATNGVISSNGSQMGIIITDQNGAIHSYYIVENTLFHWVQNVWLRHVWFCLNVIDISLFTRQPKNYVMSLNPSNNHTTPPYQPTITPHHTTRPCHHIIPPHHYLYIIFSNITQPPSTRVHNLHGPQEPRTDWPHHTIIAHLNDSTEYKRTIITIISGDLLEIIKYEWATSPYVTTT